MKPVGRQQLLTRLYSKVVVRQFSATFIFQQDSSQN